jgi:hypothetical protein
MSSAAANPLGARVPSSVRRRLTRDGPPVRARRGGGAAHGHGGRRSPPGSAPEQTSTQRGRIRQTCRGPRGRSTTPGAGMPAGRGRAEPLGVQCGVGRARAAPFVLAGTAPARTGDHAATWKRPSAPLAGRGRFRRCPGPVGARRARAPAGRRDWPASTGRPRPSRPPCGRRGPAWGPRAPTAGPPRRGRLSPAGQRRRPPALGARDGCPGVRPATPGRGACHPPGARAGGRRSGHGAPWRW